MIGGIWIGMIGFYRRHSLIHPIDPIRPIRKKAEIRQSSSLATKWNQAPKMFACQRKRLSHLSIAEIIFFEALRINHTIPDPHGRVVVDSTLARVG
jgi:hypothetical protein